MELKLNSMNSLSFDPDETFILVSYAFALYTPLHYQSDSTRYSDISFSWMSYYNGCLEP